MALEGTIKEFGLADIFQLIGLQKKTGILFLKGADCTVNIHFEDGMVVKAEDSQKNPKRLLGSILLRRGKVGEQQLQDALEAQAKTMQKVGSVLVGMGAITKEDLRDALAFQMTEIIYKVFTWKGGDYKFYQDKVDYDRDTVKPISSEHLLMDGVRMLDEWPMVEKKLPKPEVVLQRRPVIEGASDEEEKADDIFTDFGHGKHGAVSKDASEVLKLVDGVRSLHEVLDSSSLGEFDTSKAIVELIEKGLVYQTDTKAQVAFEELLAPEIKRRRPSVNLTIVPVVLAAAVLVIIFLQITGTRKIMSPRETGLAGLKTAFVQNQVETLEDNVNLYFMDYGTYPQRLSDLSKLDYVHDSGIVDPWGMAFIISGKSEGEHIESAGPDRLLGTHDDVSSAP